MIDEIDRKLLEDLQEDARTSYAELGLNVLGSQRPPSSNAYTNWRIGDNHRLPGCIHTAQVGLPITAFVRMSITGVDYSHIIEVAKESNEVLECHRGTGGDSFIMKVAVSSVEHLQELIDRLTPYGITTTTIVLSSPVKKRILNIV